MKDLGKVLYAALAGIGIFACGLNWQLLIIWFLLMTIDVITGNMRGISKGNWCSKDMKQGLFKKAAEFFLLISLVLSQKVLGMSGVTFPAGEIFAGVFSIKELGSIIENCIQMGVNVPSSVMKWFRVAQIKLEGECDTTENKEES